VVGEQTAIGTVKAIAPDDSSFTISRNSNHQLVKLPVAAGSALAAELLGGQIALGDSITVQFAGTAPAYVVISVTVTGAPTLTTTTPTTTTPPTTTIPTTTTPTTTTSTTTTPYYGGSSTNNPPTSGGSGVGV
jgi:hypothetical protein